jgi:hypothetical protein
LKYFQHTVENTVRESSHLPYLLLGTKIGRFIAQLVESYICSEQVFSEPIALDPGSSEFLVRLLVVLG